VGKKGGKKVGKKAGNENNTGAQIQCNCTVVTIGALVSVKREGLLPDVACLK